MKTHLENPKRIKAVIFDWAGTTVDCGSLAPLRPFLEVFRRKGVEITIDEARQPMGMFKRDHLNALIQMESIRERWQTVHGRPPRDTDVEAMYVEFIPFQLSLLHDYADPIPGTVAAVEALRAQDIKIGSTTGYTREMIDVLAPVSARKGYSPDSIVTINEVPAGRPAPWMALVSAMQLGVYPMETAVKVGDTIVDIEEGLNAGMWTVGLALTGNELGLDYPALQALPVEELAARREKASQHLYLAGAHFVVDGVWDVPKIVDEINQKLAEGQKP